MTRVPLAIHQKMCDNPPSAWATEKRGGKKESPISSAQIYMKNKTKSNQKFQIQRLVALTIPHGLPVLFSVFFFVV